MLKRVPCSAALCACIALWAASCMPPEAEKNGGKAGRPATSAPAKKAGAPKVRPSPKLFLFLPQERHSFVGGEIAEVTLVLDTPEKLSRAAVELSLTNGDGATWTTTDALRNLPPGRHAMTYGITVGHFPPGSYKLSAQIAGASFGTEELVFASAVPRTHYPLAAWLAKPPRNERDVARWSRALGLNTVLLQSRDSWRSAGAHVVDSKYLGACEKARTARGAQPVERMWSAPPLVRTADLLTGAGLRWLNACAVSGGGRPPLQRGRALSDPMAVRGGRQRIHHRLMAERRFRNCLGLHLTDEATLSGLGPTASRNPFDSPAELQAFKERYGVEKVPWRRGARLWVVWEKFVLYRAGILGGCLGDWADAVRAAGPQYVAASSLTEPMGLAYGAYPPLQAKGLPVILAHVPLEGPAGMMMPAIAADLQRAGNWDKRLWMMPQVAADADLDEIRASLNLAIARKLDGIVYPPALDYHLDRPDASQLSTELLAGISGINAAMTRLGDFLLALEKPRDNVAILYSRTEHIARMGKDPVNDPLAADYPWTLMAAYEAAMAAHYPATFLTEEELLAGEGAKSKVVLVIGIHRVRPEVKAALEGLAASGVAVLTDPTTAVKLEGAAALPIEFPDLYKQHQTYEKAAAEAKIDPTRERRDVVVHKKLIAPLLTRLKNELRPRIKRDYTVSDTDVIICEQRCGDGRYLFVANNTQRDDIFRGLKWELSAARTQVTLREGDYVLYDVVEGAKFSPPRVRNRPVIQLIMPAGGLAIFALLPEPVGGVRIRRARLAAGRLEVEAFVHPLIKPPPDFVDNVVGSITQRLGFGRKPRPMNAAVPIEVSLVDPTGAERLRIHRTHVPGGYRESIPVPPLDKPGKWKVVIREQFSGTAAEETFWLSDRRAPQWARRLGHLRVFDGERIRGLLRSSQPLWIIVATEAEAKKAARLAATLRTSRRPVEVKLASDVTQLRKLSTGDSRRYVSPAPDNAPMPDIRQAAILLGQLGSHPLLSTVHNYGILPRAVTADYPGQGGAVLCWLLSAFEPDVEVVAAVAADEAGLDRAIHALRRAARGGGLETAWRPLPAGTAVAAGKATPKASIVQLAATWRHRRLDDPSRRHRRFDNPTAAAAPFLGEAFAVGFHDGLLVSFDPIGKPSWAHQCPTRVRAVAVSPKGAWTVAGSFPEVRLLGASGRVQWGAPIPETYKRADITAVATSADAMLTVAGTRHGKVLGLALAPSLDKVPAYGPPLAQVLFTVGMPPAGEEIDPKDTRLGAVRAIGISPTLEFVVVGCERETIALDPGKKGKELWASKVLRRVASLAVSLGEEPMIAVGSRDGYVACVTKSGEVKWRKPVGGYVVSLCFQGTTQKILAASLDGTLTCFGPDGERLWSHTSPVGYRFVASSVDGETLAAAEAAGRAFLLDSTGRVFAQTDKLPGMVRVMALSAAGDHLLVGTSTSEIAYYKYHRPKPGEDEL